MVLARFLAKKLSPQETLQNIEAIKKHCLPIEGLLRIVLFGSAARGEMTDMSDLDAVLIFDSKESAKKGAKHFYSIPRLFSFPVDALFVDEVRFKERSELGGVLYVAKKEGKIIFEREI